jgi:TorA maturation chaperone TorD
MPYQEGMNKARAQLLEITARLLIREVDALALKALLEPQFLDALEAYEPGTRRYLESVAGAPEAGLEGMAVDFCALFLTNSATAPYASAWSTTSAQAGSVGEPRAATTEQMLKSIEGWMREVGMEIAPGEWGNVPRDHVAVLAGLVAHALHAGPTGAMLAKEINQHALFWVDDFKVAVCSRTENPLYRASVRMLCDALVDL